MVANLVRKDFLLVKKMAAAFFSCQHSRSDYLDG